VTDPQWVESCHGMFGWKADSTGLLQALKAGQTIQLEMPRETITCRAAWARGFEAVRAFASV